MRFIFILSLIGSLIGCAGQTSNTAPADSQAKPQPKVKKIEEIKVGGAIFKEDPLLKIKKFDVSIYYGGIFGHLEGRLRQKYSGPYLSMPQGYMVDGKLMGVSPWVPTPIQYTVFPTAHFTIVSFHHLDEPLVGQFKQEDLLSALRTQYEVREVDTPVFHYVLEVAPEQLSSFESDIYELLKSIKLYK